MNATFDSAPSRRLNSVRGLLPFLRPHRGLLAAWLGALTLSSIAMLIMPVAVKHMIDQGFQAGADVDGWFLLLFAVASVLAIATAARFFFVSLLGEKVIADLRQHLYGHLLSLDQSFFERSRTGELMSRLSADTELLRSVIGSSMSVALRSGINLIGCATMLVVTNPRLAGLALVGIPLIVLPAVIAGRHVQAVSKHSQDRVADANALAGETLGAIHTVQSYVREDFEHDRFGEAVQLALKAARKRIRLQSLLTGSFIVLAFGAVSIVLWIGAEDVIAGKLSAGVLSQFMLYALLGAGSIGALSEVWAEVQRATGGIGRISELLEERSTLTVRAQARALPPRVHGELVIEHVTFHYPTRPDTPALQDFSLQVRPGETVALVGPSGAGKSTVFQLLLRFHDPDRGRVMLDGHDLREIEPAALRRQIALVPQGPVTFATTARDNLRYGRLEASDEALIAAARSAEAHDFLSTLPQGYDSELGERGARLSGGQQQRLVIARALLKDAPILLLDEATSALDAHSERAIQQALERLMQGRTTIVIAHRLATVLKSDRIVVMDKGRVIAEGTHNQLLAQGGLYAELARLQFDHTSVD